MRVQAKRWLELTRGQRLAVLLLVSAKQGVRRLSR